MRNIPNLFLAILMMMFTHIGSSQATTKWWENLTPPLNPAIAYAFRHQERAMGTARDFAEQASLAGREVSRLCREESQDRSWDLLFRVGMISVHDDVLGELQESRHTSERMLNTGEGTDHERSALRERNRRLDLYEALAGAVLNRFLSSLHCE